MFNSVLVGCRASNWFLTCFSTGLLLDMSTSRKRWLLLRWPGILLFALRQGSICKSIVSCSPPVWWKLQFLALRSLKLKTCECTCTCSKKHFFFPFNYPQASCPLVSAFLLIIVYCHFSKLALRISQSLMWQFSIPSGLRWDLGLGNLLIVKVILGWRASLFVECACFAWFIPHRLLGADQKTERQFAGLWKTRVWGSHWSSWAERAGKLSVTAKVNGRQERWFSSWDFIKFVSWNPSLGMVKLFLILSKLIGNTLLSELLP